MQVASEATAGSWKALRQLADFFMISAIVGWIVFSTAFLAALNAPVAMLALVAVLNCAFFGWAVLVQRRKRSERKWRIGDAAHPRLVRAAQLLSLAIQLGFILWMIVPPIARTERIDGLHAPRLSHNEIGLMIVGILLALGVVFRWTWEVREYR